METAARQCTAGVVVSCKIPILTLLPTFGKFFDKILNNRLQDELEKGKKINNRQCGFRKNRGTINAMDRVIQAIKNRTSKYCACMLLDIESAFDSVRWELIITELEKLKISNYLVNMYKSFLENRFIFLECDTERKIKKISRGTPQGSCSSPTLWNIVMNIILEKSELENVECIAYADDLMIISYGDSREKLQHETQRCLNNVLQNCENLKLKLSPGKSKIIWFGDIKKRRGTSK